MSDNSFFSSVGQANPKDVSFPQAQNLVYQLPSSLDNVGDGSINERRRKGVSDKPTTRIPTTSSNFDPLRVRSHLYHALEGLDRYPHYLSRWNNEEDMVNLEYSLLHRANLVRMERERIQEFRQTYVRSMLQDIHENTNHDDSIDNANSFHQLINPPKTWEDLKDHVLHPDAVKAIFSSKMWKKGSHELPTVKEVLSGSVDVQLDTASMAQIMEEESYDVFSIPLLRPEFCKQLQTFISDILTIIKAQLLNNKDFLQLRPSDLDVIGIGWINDLLFHLILRPLSRHLFQSSETKADLDWRQGYVTVYDANPDVIRPRTNLVAHTDDSEVTLNVCISNEKDFNGGLLEFLGLRGTSEQGQILGTYQPRVGKALLHAGRHLHRVTPVTEGNRYAYILWARSWQGSRSLSCPCCWLNRRTDNLCVCGPAWN